MAKWRRLPISLPLLTACKLRTPQQQLCPQTHGKAAFKDYFCSLSIRKPLYPINLLAIGYFTLRSIMFSEKERVMKVPFGLTSNVFLDELQPGKLLGSFWKVKSIKPFNKIMLQCTVLFFSKAVKHNRTIPGTDWSLHLAVGVCGFNPIFHGVSNTQLSNDGPSLWQIWLKSQV